MIYKTKYLFSEEFMWASSFTFRKEDFTIVALLEFDGKGIIGSLKTLIADSILSELVHDRKIFHSGDIIRYVKEEVDAAGSSELMCDLKISVLVVDNYKKTIQFSGLNQDMILFNGNEMIILEGEDEDRLDSLADDKIELKEGSSFYMFTNGYYSQENTDGIKFGYDKFEELLKTIHEKDMESQGKFMTQTIDDWIAGKGLTDDVTVIGFRLND